MKKIIILIFMTTFSLNSQILNERERANKINEILKNRFDNVLPELMDKTEIDMWILISREYNEDPVLKTMLPAEWLNARRRTIIVFYRDKLNNTLDKLAVARYNFGDNIISAWDKDKQPDQWKRLNEIIEERNPKKIGLNYIKCWKKKFKCNVGISIHSSSISPAIASITEGADIIEVHVKTFEDKFNPDNSSSISIEQLNNLCNFRNDYLRLLDPIGGTSSKPIYSSTK